MNTHPPIVSSAVSVVVPVRNAQRHLSAALESLASQSLLDFEVIVVDDGSTDNSAAIADGFANRDGRFRRVEGSGVRSAGAARNSGIAVARGEYLAFLDADDLYASSMLEKLYARAKADDADVVLTGFQTLDESTGKRSPQPWGLRLPNLPSSTPFAPEDLADLLFHVTNPANWNKLFRRAFITEAGIWFQELPRANDAFFTYLSLAKARRITYVPEDLVIYRVGNSASLQGSNHESPLDFARAIGALYERLREDGLYPRYERAFANLVVAMSVGALGGVRTESAFRVLFEYIKYSILPLYGIDRMEEGAFASEYLRNRTREILDLSPSQWLFKRTRASTQVPQHDLVAGDERRAQNRTVEGSLLQRSGALTDRPDVSVIVPIYNAESWLHECLLSILAQTGVSIEVICVNDGSTDTSPRILSEYAITDPRVSVVDQPNGGLSVARNAGIERARGRYICMIDSDDYWREDRLAELVSRADRDSLDVLLFDAQAFFEPGVSQETFDAYAGYYTRNGSYSKVQSGSCLMAEMSEAGEYRPSACLYLVNRDFVIRNELRFVPGLMHEDNPFTFALVLQSQRAAHMGTAFYARRVRPGSIMTAGAAERSMRGYFVAYLNMIRSLAQHPVDDALGSRIGDVVHRMIVATRRLFVDASEAAVRALRDTDRSPEAQSIYRMLVHERNQALRINRLMKDE